MLNYMVQNNLKRTGTLFISSSTSRQSFTSRPNFIITPTTRQIIKDMSNLNVRWAFNVQNWSPTPEQILNASSYIQPEEKTRISKFVFQDDAKSSLIGRLMLRKFIHNTTNMPYNEIGLGRDGHGKPVLLGAGDVSNNFNVSHQGDYVVLAGDVSNRIGVDVMKIEPPANKNIPEFFRIMNKQFSQQEWKKIRSFETELEQVACFYRHWCLKESYVKNTGLGITVNLAELSFDVKTPTLSVGKIETSTVLYEKGVLKQNWKFEETLLDDKHAVATAICISDGGYEPVSYNFLTFDDIVCDAKPLAEPDVNFRDIFMKKKIKLF